MKSKQRKVRLAVSGVLLAAVVATGIYAYNQDHAKEEQARQEEQARLSEEQEQLSENVNTSNADADMPEEEVVETEPEKTEEPEEAAQPEEAGETAETESRDAAQEPEETASGTVLPAPDFQEDTVLTAPVSGTSGEILIPYSMDRTVYFPTLGVYKCSPAVAMAAEVGTPVAAVARSQVLLVEEDPQTGLTVTMDMGNGYQAVYGQLADVTLQAGDLVEAGTVIGTVSEPTRYYVKEGSNLYFAMSKDGTSLDPTEYLALQAE